MEVALAGVTPHQWISLLAVVAVLLAVICMQVLRNEAARRDSDPAESERIEPSVAEALQPASAPLIEPQPAHVSATRVPLRERLTGTSESLVGRLAGVLRGRTVDQDVLADLEGLLFTADLGVRTAESLLEAVRAKASGLEASAVRAVLREAILEKLSLVQPQPVEIPDEGLFVILVLGVNGSGKTTSIAKLAHRFQEQGKRVLLGAADTYRAGQAYFGVMVAAL